MVERGTYSLTWRLPPVPCFCRRYRKTRYHFFISNFQCSPKKKNNYSFYSVPLQFNEWFRWVDLHLGNTYGDMGLWDNIREGRLRPKYLLSIFHLLLLHENFLFLLLLQFFIISYWSLCPDSQDVSVFLWFRGYPLTSLSSKLDLIPLPFLFTNGNLTFLSYFFSFILHHILSI